jgi:protein TonB
MKHVYALSLLLLCCSYAVAVHPGRVRAGEAIMQRLLIRKVDPVYPADAARIEGSVVLLANISKAGDVESLKLISGHPILAPAAIDAVK